MKLTHIQTNLNLLRQQDLHPRLRELYGRMRLHANEHGLCYASHAGLAREIGLRDRKHVLKLQKRLEMLGLIERIKRNPRSVTYRVHPPDVVWKRHQMSPGDDTTLSPASDMHKEKRFLKDALKNVPASQPSRGTGGQAGRLVAIEAIIVETLGRYHPGEHPRAKLVAQAAAKLDGIPLEVVRSHFAKRLQKAKGLGFALPLADELRERCNRDARAREQRDVDKRGREAAQLDQQVRTLESLRDDPKTPTPERAEIQSMIDDLRHNPKSETTGGRKSGAA